MCNIWIGAMYEFIIAICKCSYDDDDDDIPFTGEVIIMHGI
jgi:hypothetical protein